MKTFPGYVEFEGSEHWLEDDAITTALRAVPVPPTPPPKTPAKATVVAKDNAFTPKEVLVKVNEVVTWKNEDKGPHTVTFNTITPGLGRTIPGTHEMKPGETYTASFPACGDYTYHCDHVPGMTGTVCVSD